MSTQYGQLPLSDGDADLADVLQKLVEHDRDYDMRYPLVFEAVTLALYLGYKAGIAIDPAEPDWPVAYIELPTGQVSWHMPKHTTAYDGHSTGEKHDRINRFQHGSRRQYSYTRPGGS